MTRSRIALLNTPCSMTWYLVMLRGEGPPAQASVTQACTNDGVMELIARLPKKGRKWWSRQLW